MTDVYSSRLALVTGGASGIGLALGRSLARRGMHVVLADIEGEAAVVAAEELTREGWVAAGHELDIRNEDQWVRVLDQAEARFGPLAVVCANAGVAGSVLPLTVTEQDAFRWTYEVNVLGAFLAIRHAAPRLRATGRPSAFMATSSLAPWAPSAHNGAYAASKAAVISLCESLRAEMRSDVVTVSLLAPGLVKTNLLTGNARLAPDGADIGEHSAQVAAAMADSVSADDVADFAVDRMFAGAFWIFPDPVSRNLIAGHQADVLSSV